MIYLETAGTMNAEGKGTTVQHGAVDYGYEVRITRGLFEDELSEFIHDRMIEAGYCVDNEFVRWKEESQARGVSTGFEDTDTYVLRRVNLQEHSKLSQTERDILEKSVYDDFKKVYAQAKRDFFHAHYDLPLSKHVYHKYSFRHAQHVYEFEEDDMLYIANAEGIALDSPDLANSFWEHNDKQGWKMDTILSFRKNFSEFAEYNFSLFCLDVYRSRKTDFVSCAEFLGKTNEVYSVDIEKLAHLSQCSDAVDELSWNNHLDIMRELIMRALKL